MDGDLSGSGRLDAHPERDGTVHIRFDWIVFADRPLLRYLTPIVRPIFRWNHNWSASARREGLEPYPTRGPRASRRRPGGRPCPPRCRARGRAERRGDAEHAHRLQPQAQLLAPLGRGDVVAAQLLGPLQAVADRVAVGEELLGGARRRCRRCPDRSRPCSPGRSRTARRRRPAARPSPRRSAPARPGPRSSPAAAAGRRRCPRRRAGGAPSASPTLAASRASWPGPEEVDRVGRRRGCARP